MYDDEMYFIRNLKYLDEGNENYRTYEYELKVDASFVGSFENSVYEIMLWDLGAQLEGEERKLILRMKEANNLYDYNSIEKSKKKIYYHGGGMADEIVALSSLFLRRRIKLVQCVREDDVPIIFTGSTTHSWNDKALITGQTNLNSLNEWFNLVSGLDKKYNQIFILAARLYHRSILMIEEDPDLAYLTLISAIETLCQDHPLKEKPAFSEMYPKLDHEIETLVDDTILKNKLKNLFLKQERFISRKFVAFIIDYIDDEFWNDVNRPEHGQIKKENLEKYLKNVYIQRSKTLHKGKAFFPLIFHPPTQNAEIGIGLSLMSKGKKWDKRDYIPNVHFFERLVNHVLKNFLKRKQISEE
jgi:hypothetical protein